MSDYDGAWKARLDRFLRWVLLFFFPEVEKEIDWTERYTPRDPILLKIIPAGEVGDRIADKLFLANEKDTGELRLYHIEVQGKKHQDFERRVYRYGYRAEDAEDIHPETLVILADEDSEWKPTTYEVIRKYSRLTFRFEPAKLLDHRGREEWLRIHENLVGLFVLAHLEAQRTTKDKEARANVKLDLLQELASRKLDEEDTRHWYAILDRLLYLDEVADVAVYQEVARRTKEGGMEFITRAEKVGMAKGKVEGLISALEMLLESKFAAAGLALMEDARKIEDPARLALILRATHSIASPDDFHGLLSIPSEPPVP